MAPAFARRVAGIASACVGSGIADLSGPVDQATHTRGRRRGAGGDHRRQRLFCGSRVGRMVIRTHRRPAEKSVACVRKPGNWRVDIGRWRNLRSRSRRPAVRGAARSCRCAGLAPALCAGRHSRRPDGRHAAGPDARGRAASHAYRPCRRSLVCSQYGWCDRRNFSRPVCPDSRARRVGQRLRRRRAECRRCVGRAASRSPRACARSSGGPATFSNSGYRSRATCPRAVCAGRWHRTGLRGRVVTSYRPVHQHPKLRLLDRAGHLLVRSRPWERPGVASCRPRSRSVGNVRTADRGRRSCCAAGDRLPRRMVIARTGTGSQRGLRCNGEHVRRHVRALRACGSLHRLRAHPVARCGVPLRDTS